MQLFNTLTCQLEPLLLTDNRASLYVCGVTPYDTTHLGHAFTYVSFDVLLRFLRYRGVDVTYAQNVTDIDDDILRKSHELGLEYDALATRETARFQEDMQALNVVVPDHYIAATETIPDIVKAIGVLIDRGHAYVSDGNVYFANGTFPGYGAISHSDRAGMLQLAAEHGGFPDDPAKRDPLDFLLWQKHLPGEPDWPSPFGHGRPGWHIECSTIATRFLGLPVSIHGGGADLIFPHHASEIGQAESATGIAPFVQHWMHTAMVRMDGKKMSKSLGNMVFVRDLLKTYSADAIRLYLLAHHYREGFEWNESELKESARLADRLRHAAETGSTPLPGHDAGVTSGLDDILSNDLQTPKAIRELDRLTRSGTGSSPDHLEWSRHVLGLRLNGSGA